jgi:hypothetical protein
MVKIITSLCFALAASDMLSWNRALNSNRHHRATNLNRVRFGEEAFAGATFRKLPKTTVFDEEERKIGRKSIRKRMRESFRRKLLD